MDNRQCGLSQLGWSDWFEQRASCGVDESIARVAAVDRDLLLLVDQSGQFRARLSGGYLHRHGVADELPCVGDWVCVERINDASTAVVRERLPRRTALRRRAAGGAVEFQMIAANIDYALVVQSCHFDFNLKRLERYLVMVTDGGAIPCILLTKTDLVSAECLEAQLEEIRTAGITATVITLSNLTRDGQNSLIQWLLPEKTYCFIGSSGVGKSTLINHLLATESQQTQVNSETGEGRHTTVRRQLIRVPGGALVIDTPGMREFGVAAAEEGLGVSYADIDALAGGCRYRDCSHTNEPGCAVLEAVNSGEIGREHHQNYLKLRAESEFYRMSSAEKRKKQRDFGKLIKSVKNTLRDI